MFLIEAAPAVLLGFVMLFTMSDGPKTASWLTQEERDYVARRTAEGKTNREIKRCLTRYVARHLYRLLESGAAAA